jgi:hypothetical protein
MGAKRRTVERIFGVTDLVAAAVIVLGVFVGLPARWWVVDAPAAVLTVLLAAAGLGLVGGAVWATRVARVASIVALAAGLVLVTTLAVTASYLSGVYGAVGLGGSVILVLVAALALPYLVAFPAAQLLWLGPAGPRPGEVAAPKADKAEEPA